MNLKTSRTKIRGVFLLCKYFMNILNIFNNLVTLRCGDRIVRRASAAATAGCTAEMPADGGVPAGMRERRSAGK